MLNGNNHWLRMQRFGAPKRAEKDTHFPESPDPNHGRMYVTNICSQSIAWPWLASRIYSHVHETHRTARRKSMAVAGIIVVRKAPFRQVPGKALYFVCTSDVLERTWKCEVPHGKSAQLSTWCGALQPSRNALVNPDKSILQDVCDSVYLLGSYCVSQAKEPIPYGALLSKGTG